MSRPLAARVSATGAGEANVATGLPVLDHLLAVLARYGGFELALEIAPGGGADPGAAGRALGEELHALVRADARGWGSASLAADEALAGVVLETAEEPALYANVDLSEARIGGLETDLAAAFLRGLADAAGITLHIRLIEGRDAAHVLEAIFKTLGVALAQACRPRKEEE